MIQHEPVLVADGISRCREDRAGSFTIRVENLTINRGEVLAITGPSGTGKSTLLELLGLVLSPDTAKTFKMGNGKKKPKNVYACWEHKHFEKLAALRARNIGYLHQNGELLPFLTVEKNIFLPLSLLGYKRDPKTIKKMLNYLGLEPLLKRYPKALSAGERQRVALARALIHRPALLLADEPTAALDPDNADRVFNLLLELVVKQGTAAIIVSHDIERVRKLKLKEISPKRCSEEFGTGSVFIGEEK